MSARRWQRNQSDPIVDAMGRLTTFVFGPDRATRARTAAILLCALMYVVCCSAAFQAADIGVMRAEAPLVLLWTTLPAYGVFYGLVRSGRSKRLKDPTLMMPQTIFALMAIAYAYTAVGPADRGIVLVLVALVMVFGMYTHTPRQSLLIGGVAMLLMGASMGVLSQWDPVYYPPTLELLRFELMMGTLPALIFSAYQISAWRNRVAEQRRALREALEQVEQPQAFHDARRQAMVASTRPAFSASSGRIVAASAWSAGSSWIDAVSWPSRSAISSSSFSRRCWEAWSVSFFRASRSILSWTRRRSISSRASGLESTAMRTRLPASSIRSMALSGRKRSVM